MRKFQYLVTIDLDDEHLEGMVRNDPSLLEGETLKHLTPETFVSFLAENMAPGMDIALRDGLGDTGNSQVKTVFKGEILNEADC